MKFFDIIKIRDVDIEKSQKDLYLNTPEFWDCADSINLNLVKNNCANIQAKYSKLEQNPKLISKQFLIAYIIGIIGTSLGIFLLTEGIGGDFSIVIIILSWIYAGVLHQTYKKLAIDIIKLQIAKTKNWIYDPKEDYQKWNKIKNIYPELFDKGNKNRYLEDQFWGKTQFKNKEFYFHSGLFSYDVESRDSKGRRHTTTYKKNFIALYTPKKINSRFYIYPENLFSQIGNLFTKKEIETESNEFNKSFAFSYNGSKVDNNMEIIRTLSPSVQEKLVELKNRKKSVSVLFSGNVVTFMFEGILFKKLHTNFRKSLEIDQKDIEFIDKELQDVVDISTEMMQYLD